MRVVRYHYQRGSGRTLQCDRRLAIIVDEEPKRLKVIILAEPMVVRWVKREEEAHMEPLKKGGRVVPEFDDEGKRVGQHIEGGRDYPVGKARELFRRQWRVRNEGKLPAELSTTYRETA